MSDEIFRVNGSLDGAASRWVGKSEAEVEKQACTTVAQFEGLSPNLGRWLDCSAQVQENLTLREHSVAVLTQFGLVWPYHLKRFPEDVGRTVWMEALLVLHDLGKALGDKRFQHATTPLLMPRYLRSWGFKDEMVEDAILMARHDVIGHTLKWNLALEPALASLTQFAGRSNMGIQAFLRLQWIYYVSDSSSYPCLRTRLFRPDPVYGLLMPSARELTRRLLGEI